MAVTKNTYTGNGSNKNFTFSFTYLDTSHVKATINGTATTAFTFFNSSTLQFTTAPANGAAVVIYRDTYSDGLLAEYSAGSALRESDLELNFKQALNLAQESENIATEAASSVSAAVTASNTAVSQVNTAVTTANAASTAANTALSTANSALSASTTASSDASAALTAANAAASAVSSVVPYTSVANLAALLALTPTNNARYELVDSTGANASASIIGIPGGVTGSSALTIRFIYYTSNGKFNYISYFPNDPESRYATQTALNTVSSTLTTVQTTANGALQRSGGTMTGNITFNGAQTFPVAGIQSGTTAQSGVVQLTDSIGSTSTTTAATPNSVKTAYDLANAALSKGGGTMTGNITFSGTQTFPVAGIQTAGVAQAGVVQLNNTTTSTSLTQAPTANALKTLADTVATLPVDNTITTVKIVDSAVTTVKINNAAVTPAKLSQPMTLMTSQNTTAGTSIDFTGIPSWVKRITVMFNGVSVVGTSGLMIQLGISTGPETTGYVGAVHTSGGGNYNSNGYLLTRGVTGTSTVSGSAVITNVSGNIWVISGVLSPNVTDGSCYFGGTKTLGGTLDRVRLTNSNGTDTFDAGSVNILYEG